MLSSSASLNSFSQYFQLPFHSHLNLPVNLRVFSLSRGFPLICLWARMLRWCCLGSRCKCERRTSCVSIYILSVLFPCQFIWYILLFTPSPKSSLLLWDLCISENSHSLISALLTDVACSAMLGLLDAEPFERKIEGKETVEEGLWMKGPFLSRSSNCLASFSWTSPFCSSCSCPYSSSSDSLFWSPVTCRPEGLQFWMWSSRALRW